MDNLRVSACQRRSNLFAGMRNEACFDASPRLTQLALARRVCSTAISLKLLSTALVGVACVCCLVSNVQAISGSQVESSSGICWGEDLTVAFRQSARTGKPIMLHFYSDNCPPCKMLETRAFRDPRVTEVTGSEVIAVKINVDEHRDIADRYDVTRWPTDVYLYPNGDVLGKTISPQDPKKYSELLARVVNLNNDWEMLRRTSKSGESTIAANLATPTTAQTPSSVLPSKPFATTNTASAEATSQNSRTPSSTAVFQKSSENTNRLVTHSSVFEAKEGASGSTQPNPYCVSVSDSSGSITQECHSGLTDYKAAEVSGDLTKQPRSAEVMQGQTANRYASEVRQNQPQFTTISNPYVASSNQPSEQSANVVRGAAKLNNSTFENVFDEYPQEARGSAEADQHALANATLAKLASSGSMDSPAMDGYCPVTLATREAWIEGSSSYSVRHRGRVYHLLTEEARQEFLEQPDKYAAVWSGYDIVHFCETGKLENGRREFGLRYAGKVFLFRDAQTQAIFDKNLRYYTQELANAADAANASREDNSNSPSNQSSEEFSLADARAFPDDSRHADAPPVMTASRPKNEWTNRNAPTTMNR